MLLQFYSSVLLESVNDVNVFREQCLITFLFKEDLSFD